MFPAVGEDAALPSSIPTIRLRVEAGSSYACSLQIDGLERARWTLSGRAPAELREVFVKRYIGRGLDDERSGPESLDEFSRLCVSCLPGPLIDERRIDHLEEQLEAAGKKDAPPLVLGLEVDDELRDLPLEAGWLDPEFEHEGVRSVCLDDRVVVARRGSGPGLVADSELRALVVDCGEGESLEEKSLQELCGENSSVTVLANPTYAALEAYLSEERDHNVLVTIGHVEWSGSGQLASMTLGDGPRPCTEVARLAARSLPELKVLVLGGCESWSSLAPAFEALAELAAGQGGPEPVLTSIPALVAHHFKVAPRTERGAVTALLQALRTSSRIDVGFRAYRAALGRDDVCGKAMRSSAVLRLAGEGLELVTRDPGQVKRLRYARAIRQRYSRVRLPGDAKRDVDTLRSRGGYLERDITYMVRVKEAGDGLDSNGDGPGEDRERQVREHEALILDRLLKGHRSVVGLKAPAGVGKTALVHNMAYRLATDYLREGSGPLPVCVELRGYGPSLKDLVERTLTKGLTIQDLESGGYVLLADGLDEAAGKYRLREELKTLPNTTEENDELPPPSASLVSSRPESARSDLPHFGRDREGGEEHIFELEPWDVERIERYVAHHFTGLDEARGDRLIAHIKSSPILVLLAGQPLVLWMFCGQAETTPIDQLPSTATALLEVGIGRILRRRNENLVQGERALGEADLRLIAELCWARANSAAGLTVRSARNVLRDALTSARCDAWELGITGEVSRDAVDNLLDELVTRSGLLTAHGPLSDDATALLPSDIRFQEFLVARLVAEAINEAGWDNALVFIAGKQCLAAQWVSDKAWLPEMLNTIAQLAGQLDEPGPMFQELATETPTTLNKWGDDSFRHRLAAALGALAECTPSSLVPSSALIATLLDDAFTLWWTHLLRDTDHCVAHIPQQLIHLLPRPDLPLSALCTDHLFRSLHSDDTTAASSAARGFGSLSPTIATEGVLVRLADGIASSHQRTRENSAFALECIASLWSRDPVWRRHMRDNGMPTPTSPYATMSAAHIAHMPHFLTRLEHLLTSTTLPDYNLVLTLPGVLGPALATDAIVSLLHDLLDHSDQQVRKWAAFSIGGLGERCTEEIRNRLPIAVARDGGSWELMTALERLGLRVSSPELTDALFAIMSDPEAPQAHRALCRVTPPESISTLVDRIKPLLWHDEAQVRSNAIDALGHLGETAARADVLMRFAQLLEDSWTDSHVVEALRAIGPLAAIPPLVQQLAGRLGHPSRSVRYASAQSIGALGTAAATEATITGLLNMLRWSADEDGDVEVALGTLAELGRDVLQGPLWDRWVDWMRKVDCWAERLPLVERHVRLANEYAPDVLEVILPTLLRCDITRTCAEVAATLDSARMTDAIAASIMDVLTRDNRGGRWGAATVIRQWHSRGVRLFQQPPPPCDSPGSTRTTAPMHGTTHHLCSRLGRG